MSPTEMPELRQEGRARSELEKQLLSMHVEMYKHHFDLWLKAQALYVAIQGTVAGIVFRTDTSQSVRTALCVFAGICSASAFCGGFLTRKWLNNTQNALTSIATRLDIERFDLTLAKQTVIYGQVVAAILLGAALMVVLDMLSGR